MMGNNEAKKERKNKYNRKKVALAVVLLIVATFAVIKLLSSITSAILGHSISSHAIEIETDATSDYDYCNYNGGVLYMNSQGVKLYDSNGKYKSDVVFGAYNPYVEISGDYAVLCDMNSSKLALMFKDKLYKEFETKQPVVFATVNGNGDVAAVTSEKGYKSSVYIYDKKGNEKYIWHSGSGYIIDCALSSNGKKFVILSLNSENGKINSLVTWFDVSKEQPYGQVIIEDCFAYELMYTNSDAFVISGSGIYKTNPDEITDSVDFEGRVLLGFDIDSDNNIVTSQKVTNSQSRVVKYDKKLNVKYSKELEFEVDNISCSGKKTAVSGQNELLILGKSGKTFARGAMVGEAEDILLSENNEKIYSFSQDKIKIYSVKLGR